MTRAPSAILVVRHGARLDAADADWHLTSPAPYDPPLTYGGWNQAKALGSRIAHILSTRAAQSNARRDGPNGTRNGGAQGQGLPKKQKVVIHTSPFLRCLQTSVAISAGMAQSLERPETKGKMRRTSSKSPGFDRVRSVDNFSVKAMGLSTPDQVNIKTTLRVDAFLGEWLSPDYYEVIMPPPNSTMMVATAKATLLHREPVEVYETNTPKPGHFPGGWSKANTSRLIPSAVLEEDDMTVDTMSLMVPLRMQRSNSANDTEDNHGHARPIMSELRPSKAAYNPPVPAYAIAPSHPIPRGYCGHARDACIDLDLLWDSMRLPQPWGDGGTFGEEWSAMHKRFRKGLSSMIDWYTRHTPEYHPDREDPLALDHELTDDEDEDGDYELTVILVTHAAGCNALVGALTDQPVLHDFGLTSLSMAVKRDMELALDGSIDHDGHSTSPTGRRHSPMYSSIAEDYKMEIVSSTKHLQAGAQATSASALTSPHLVPHIPTYDSLTHPTSTSAANPPRREVNSALGSMRRPSLAPGQALFLDTVSPSTSRSTSFGGGLWSRTSTISTQDDVPAIWIGAPAQSRETSPIIPQPPSRPISPTNAERGAKEDDEVSPLPNLSLTRTSSQHGGLWGVDNDQKIWRPRSKRRWTVTERDEMEQ